LSPQRKQITAACLHPDGDSLVTGLVTGALEVLSTKTGEKLRGLDGHAKSASPAFFVPDTRTLVTFGVDQTLRTWDIDRGSCLSELRGHTMPVTDARCLAGGRLLASCGSKEGSMTWKLWDLPRAQPVALLPLGNGHTLHTRPDWNHALIEA